MDVNFAGNTVQEDTLEGSENLSVGVAADPLALATLLGNLSDLYPNRPRAVLQEGSQNALDAGGTRPPEITLPTVNNPVVIIQDFGTGMSRSFMTGEYLQYGASDKRGRVLADGTVARGGFGLGCKTPILVSDQYIVVTVYRNDAGELEKTGLIFTKDENGLASPKRFDVEDIAPDHTGTTVTIPITGSFTEYDEQNWRALATDLYSTFGDTIKVNGEFPQSVYSNMTRLGDCVHIGQESLTPYQSPRSVSGKRGLYANVGGISYPVNIFASARYPNHSSTVVDTLLYLAQNADYKVIVSAPVEGIDVPPARDQVKDTPKSRETILNALKKAADEFTATLTADMNAAETPFEAISIWSKGNDVVPYQYIGHENRPKPQFAGEELPMSFNLTPAAHRVLVTSRNGQTERISNEDGNIVSVQYDGRYWKRRHRVVAVMGTDLSDADTATAVKMLTRPYLLAESENDTEIRELMFFKEDEFSQGWMNLDPTDSNSTFTTITLEKFLEEGRTRKASLKPQTGGRTGTRRKNTYAVYTVVKDEDDRLVADNPDNLSMTDVRSLQDGDAPVAYSTTLSRSDFAYLEGHRVVVLRETQSEDALVKRVPKAEPVARVIERARTEQAENVDQELVDLVARAEYLSDAYDTMYHGASHVLVSLMQFLRDDCHNPNALDSLEHPAIDRMKEISKVQEERASLDEDHIRDAAATLLQTPAGLNRIADAKAQYSDLGNVLEDSEESERIGNSLLEALPLLKHGYSRYLNFRGADPSHILAYIRMALA